MPGGDIESEDDAAGVSWVVVLASLRHNAFNTLSIKCGCEKVVVPSGFCSILTPRKS